MASHFFDDGRMMRPKPSVSDDTFDLHPPFKTTDPPATTAAPLPTRDISFSTKIISPNATTPTPLLSRIQPITQYEQVQEHPESERLAENRPHDKAGEHERIV